MSAAPPPPGPATSLAIERLVGRQREREAIDRLMSAAQEGYGGVLVVHGDPGIGKSSLLEYAIAQASSFRVARAVGVEGEMELPFAALQQLCTPDFEFLEGLPDPQREAVEIAFGRRGGPAPNPYLVGLAILSLLSDAAEQQPLLCVVDDAHWLDRGSEQVLTFVARRLLADRIALLFATREVGRALERLPELHVGPLGHRDARALLGSALAGPLDEDVFERLIAEAHGNPLALLELPRERTLTQLAGGFESAPSGHASEQVTESFMRRIRTLPADAQQLLLVAAADQTGDVALVWRAAERLGLGEAAVQGLAAEGILTLGPRVVFRHPLVRSAVYQAADIEARRGVHLALAEATDPEIDPDRRAWHLAEAAVAPNEEVAAVLELSAERARTRGGFAASAAFLERSSMLTVDPRRRGRRALAAARDRQRSGAFDEALGLLARAQAGPLDAMEDAEADVLRARIAAATRGSDAPALLLAAARRVEPLDIALARHVYLDALAAALFAGRLAGAADVHQVATAARAAAPAEPPRAEDLLLDGLASLIVEGSAVGTPLLREAIGAFGSAQIDTDEVRRWLWLAGRTAAFIWDYESWDSLTRRQIRSARADGALAELPLALSTRVGVHIFAGEMPLAASLVAESDELAEATDARIVPIYGALSLAAFSGRDQELAGLLATSRKDLTTRGEGMGMTLSYWVSAALHNGQARYDEAYLAAEKATENGRELFFSTFATVELIEAASRTDRRNEAVTAIDVLRESTSASGTPWASGVEARSRALLASDDAAEPLYREAIERLEPTRVRLDLARARLVYGEWLRRQRRRTEARAELRQAYELFTDFRMDGFAERARVELEATGEHARKRTVDTLDQLTPQEAQISRLAGQGHTNREIAAQLFISPSTVEYHLRKAFRKLDVTSRVQLANRFR